MAVYKVRLKESVRRPKDDLSDISVGDKVMVKTKDRGWVSTTVKGFTSRGINQGQGSNVVPSIVVAGIRNDDFEADRVRIKESLKESYGDSPIYDHTLEAINTMFEKLGVDPDIVRQFSEWKDLEDMVVKMVLRYDDYMAGK